MFNYLMVATAIAGFYLIVWGPRRHIFSSGYKGNPTGWVVTVGYTLLVASAVIPFAMTSQQQTLTPSIKQIPPVTSSPDASISVQSTIEKSIPPTDKKFAAQVDLKSDITNAIQVCENESNFFNKNSCRFEQCAKEENQTKPECEKFLKK